MKKKFYQTIYLSYYAIKSIVIELKPKMLCFSNGQTDLWTQWIIETDSLLDLHVSSLTRHGTIQQKWGFCSKACGLKQENEASPLRVSINLSIIAWQCKLLCVLKLFLKEVSAIKLIYQPIFSQVLTNLLSFDFFFVRRLSYLLSTILNACRCSNLLTIP